ncbi:MAG: hypothetical protein HYY06_17875 [Deltaproteobacteria bacterium]|nr:hypothetical protein [Deltaproteobacteria bacterium]
MRVGLVLLVLSGTGCEEPTTGKPITARFTDHFERSTLGDQYFDTGGHWQIRSGELRVRGARNHPLWLVRRLPRNVAIELMARSSSPDGDIKVEVFGDGRSYATEDSYTASSYVVIFGGWRNSLSVIARMNEHGDDRKVRRSPRVEPGRRYRFRIERRGKKLTWLLDGERMLELDDPAPLEGEGHQYFAFNDWEAELAFDDLVIEPLGP